MHALFILMHCSLLLFTFVFFCLDLSFKKKDTHTSVQIFTLSNWKSAITAGEWTLNVQHAHELVSLQQHRTESQKGCQLKTLPYSIYSKQIRWYEFLSLEQEKCWSFSIMTTRFPERIPCNKRQGHEFCGASSGLCILNNRLPLWQTDIDKLTHDK